MAVTYPLERDVPHWAVKAVADYRWKAKLMDQPDVSDRMIFAVLLECNGLTEYSTVERVEFLRTQLNEYNAQAANLKALGDSEAK